MTEGRGETSDADHEGTESPTAKRDTQSPATGESHRRSLNLIEPPWYGPVCPVVWEGRSREAPPYPDLWGRSRTRPKVGRGERIVRGQGHQRTLANGSAGSSGGFASGSAPRRNRSWDAGGLVSQTRTVRSQP